MDSDIARTGTEPDLDQALARAIRQLIAEAVEADEADTPGHT
jgi:hypothetical protein